MNARFLAAGLAAALLSTSALADDPTTGLYGSLGAGANLSDAIKQPAGPQLNFDWGPVASVSAGWGFGNGFRTELNYMYLRDEVDSGKSFGAGGHLTRHEGLVNVLYDFTDISPVFVPHIGGGVGLDYSKGSVGNGSYRSRVGYDGIAGVEVPFDDHLRFGVDYRYLGSTRDTYANEHQTVGDNMVLLTIRYNLEGAEPAAAPPPPPPPAPRIAPPPPPAAKQPEAARQFQVFFDFDKSDLTAAAAKVVRDAADAVRAGGVAQVNVIGHTDTVGSARYNQALSERRAASVKAELIADGVPDSTIMTSGVGKADLLVPTADGVRDPQNRRAVIALQ